MLRLLLLLSIGLALAGCEKITVAECDDANHVDAGADTDALPKEDSGIGDGGLNEDAGEDRDAAGMDAEPQDGGPDCAAQYCIESLAASVDVANVREMVTFTPTVRDNGNALTFSGSIEEITASRRAELPPLDLDDVDLTFAVDPATGMAQLAVTEVPTWFSTTTFTVRVHAQAAGGPDVVAEASVTIRGNVAVSGVSDVYAIASDGLPARSVNFDQGRLLSGSSFVDSPEDLWLARDGSLLVYDHGATPPRIRRFALDGENSQLPDFQFENGGMPIIEASHTGTGMTQLSDGRVVLIDYYFSRSQESMLHVWNEDGTFSHTISAPNGLTDWSGAAGDEMGRLYVLERTSNGRLIEIDPATGFEQRVVTTDISQGYNLLWQADGSFYVGLVGSVLRVTPQGGKQMVSGLPGSTTDIFRHLAPFGPARIVATRGTSSDAFNVVVIEDTEYLGYLRRENVGGPVLSPYGIAFLD
jgi:hypothetical protein